MARILVAGLVPNETNGRALVMEFGGHTCLTAVSPAEAAAILGGGLVDLTVADSQLCGNVSKTVRLLKQASPKTPLLMLAEGSDTAEGSDRALALPCTPQQLFEAIRSMIGKPQGTALKRSQKRVPVSHGRIPPKKSHWEQPAKIHLKRR